MGKYKQLDIDRVNSLMGHVDNIRGLIKEAKEILDMIDRNDYLEFHEKPEDLFSPEEWARINKIKIPDSSEYEDESEEGEIK